MDYVNFKIYKWDTNVPITNSTSTSSNDSSQTSSSVENNISACTVSQDNVSLEIDELPIQKSFSDRLREWAVKGNIELEKRELSQTGGGPPGGGPPFKTTDPLFDVTLLQVKESGGQGDVLCHKVELQVWHAISNRNARKVIRLMEYSDQKDDYHLADSSQENTSGKNNNLTIPSTASINIKPETLLSQHTVSNGLPVKEEQTLYDEEGIPHIDHSYTNDTATMKCNQTLTSKFIKEEMDVEDEVHVKTEIVHNVKAYKCSKCNIAFLNQYIYKMHNQLCRVKVPLKPYSNNLLTQRIFKSRPQNYNQCLKKLIDCVKSNPCLYDNNNENFNNSDLKSVIWSNIATECNINSGTLAKNEWRSLKNQLLKVITHHNNASGSIRNWEYKKQMEFLLPFITDNDMHINMQDGQNNAEVSVAIEEPQNATNADENNDNIDYANGVQHVQRSKRMSVSSQKETSNSKRKREAEQPRTSQSHPLDMFFLSMCATTKNLPPYVQLQVKKKIFQAVIEAEEILAAMNNDQEKNNMMNNEFENHMSPFSVRSNVPEVWEDD
ncbi:hypothetical protein FQA39_LY10076 [Lamprigera yunnana]|nr:hypothetical protein FQA39_LY10076 [Lamprigera yunnana]